MRLKTLQDRGERGVSTPRLKNLQLTVQPGGSHPPLARRGFTLIEMLVVIAIIAVLASLIVAASMRVIGMQSQKNTTLLVQKVYDQINGRWSAVAEQANSEALPPQLLTMFPDPRQARAAYVNFRLAQQFPMTYAEAVNPDGANGANGVGPDPLFALSLNGFNPGDPQQSGVLLWLMLKNSGGGAITNQDILTPRETTPAASFPNASVFCVVDDWKQPLGFQRVQATVNPNNPNQILGPGGVPLAAQLDLPPRFYFFPVVSSNGPPMMNQPIFSYQLIIGGPIGG